MKPIKDNPTADQRVPQGATPDVRRDPFAQLVTCARSAPSRARFMAETLRTIGSFFASPYAAMHVRYPSEVLQDDCHFGPTDPNFWKTSVQEFLTESLTECRSRARLLRSKRGSVKAAFVSAPLYDASGPAIGAVALVVTGVDERSMTERLATLDALCRLASFSAEFIGRGAGTTGSAAPDRSAARAAGFSSPVELAFAITNELRNKLACEHVALGLVRRCRVRLLSVSGFDQIARKSPGVAALQGAMEECLDAGETITHARAGEWSAEVEAGPVCALHRQWHKVAGGAAVASVPLRVGDQTVAVLSLRNRSDKPFTSATLAGVRDRTEPLMPVLQLIDKASRGLARHAVDNVRAGARSLAEPGRWKRRIALAVFAMTAGWFVFGTMPYTVTGACVVKPARLRHVAAPVDGVLLEASAVAGDRVLKGQVLCRFDDRDLRQQQAELLAEWDVFDRRKDQALSANSPVDVRLAQASQALARTKLDIIESRIARTVIRAPFDGVITSGDLRLSVGGVLSRGTPLYAVAPLDGWSIEMEVPEFASASVAPNLSGEFASLAQPERKLGFEVTRVIPHAEVREKKNVFVAEARLLQSDTTLQPGMDGVASIHIGRRRVCWIALHRVIDYLRLKLWL